MIYSGSLNKKLKRANKLSAKFAIIVGEEELKKNIVILKELKNGNQEYVELSSLIKKIKSMNLAKC